MSQNPQSIDKQILPLFRFSATLKEMTQWLLIHPLTKNHYPYLQILDQYADRLMSFLFSVYEDLQLNQGNFLIKSETNQILIRGCIESTLLITILMNQWHLAEVFEKQIFSDLQRIDQMFQEASPSRKKILLSFRYSNPDSKAFLRRYEWMVDGAHKNIPLSMVDLLDYIEFENEKDKAFYTLWIRHFDTFSHPSFQLSKDLNNQENSEGNIRHVEWLLSPRGIIYETASNIISSISYFFQLIPLPFADILNGLLNLGDISNPLPFDYSQIVGDLSQFKLKQPVATYISILGHHFELKKFYQTRFSYLPNYINFLGYGISIIAQILSQHVPTNARQQSLIYLLQDLSPRFDDFFKSFFNSEIPLFYVQVRYLLESISMMFILLDEEEERSKIFQIHQSIKGFETKSSVYKYREIWDLKDDKEEIEWEKLSHQYQSEINQIFDYYQRCFNKEIDRRKIGRLNGWALFLKDAQNEKVPNAPFLILYSMGKLEKELDIKILSELKLADYANGLYEESCTYSHITAYGWFHSQEIKQKDFYLREQFLVLSMIFDGLMQKLFRFYNFATLLPEKELREINLNYTGPFSQLLLFINSHKKNKAI